MNDKKYLATKELLSVLNISKSQLDKLRRKGLPDMKLGHRTLRFDLDEVNKWLQENKVDKLN